MVFNIIAILLCVGVVVVNGFTDAPSVVATAICTGAIKMRNALWICALCNFSGVMLAFLLGSKIAEFVFSLDGARGDSRVACATLFCVIAFGIFTWLLGLPSSESHALISAMVGASFFITGSPLGIKKVGYVFVFMVASNAFALLCAFCASRLFGLRQPLRKLQICSCALNSVMHGWQDGQKLIGIALTVLYTGGGHIPFYIPVSVGIILALGTLLGGKRIIKTLGVDLVKLSSTSALCSDLGAYACLAVFSLFGIPLSTSNVKSFAIIGSGLGANERINKKATIKVILTSIATFPICFLLGYVLMAILNAL